MSFRARIGALALPLVLVVACGTSSSDLAHSGAALEEAFHASAERWDVPEPVLKGIGWEETRWFQPEGRSLIGGWGLMSLQENGSLEEAARLTGYDLDTLRHDPVANIDGAAAVLRDLADWYFAEYPNRDRARLADWFEVVKHYAGVDDAEMAEVFGVGVFRAIAQGAHRLYEDGATLRLQATPVDVEDDLIYASAEQYLQPDYPQAIWRPSPNYSSRNGTAISKVVIHTCQGGYSGCVSWLRNTAAQASAHYVISKGGEISQLVENKNKAWHARCHNPETIGIEHEGYVSDAQNYTDKMYKSSAALVRWICDKYGIPKDRSHIVGHGDPVLADCNTHTDPGPYWNWTYFLGLVNGTGGGTSTGTLKGAVFWGTNFDTDKSDTSKRIVGATVKTNTGKTATTDSSGFYTFSLAPGTYTVTASASGYSTESKQVTVTAGTTAWGSIMLSESGGAVGTVKGYVFWGDNPIDYAANVKDPSKRIAGARVTFSPGGKTATTNADGLFSIDLPPDTYTVRAEADGYTANNRPDPVTVTSGATSWGSTMVLTASANDTTPPDVVISRPADGSTTDLSPVQVEGTVADASAIATVKVNGEPTPLKSGAFSASLDLKDGANDITVEATDAEGNVGRATITVTYDAPATGVVGYVYDASEGETARVVGAKVVVGDTVEVLTDEAGAFDVEIPAGTYPILVTAAGFKSRSGTVVVTEGAKAQTTVPLEPGEDAVHSGLAVEIAFPLDGEILTARQVLVTGSAVGEGIARIEVNGVEATLGDAENAFTASIELSEGPGEIEAKAFDADGNVLAAKKIAVTVQSSGCGCTAAGGSPAGVVPGALLLLGLAAMRRRRRQV